MKVSRIVWIELDTFEIVVLTNVLLPGDISMEDFALALATSEIDSKVILMGHEIVKLL
jgi:hypothetical protein